MQLSIEQKQMIAEAFADFRSSDDIRISIRRAITSGESPYVMNPDFGRKRARHHDPVSITAAFSAVFSGTATIASVATVISVTGTALSVVGMVTGNQKLMKIGGIMGLAGFGLGLANGAGLFGAAEGAGAGLTGAEVAAEGAMTQAGDYGMNAAAEAAGATEGLLGSSATQGLEAATASQSFPINDALSSPPASAAPPVEAAATTTTTATTTPDVIAGEGKGVALGGQGGQMGQAGDYGMNAAHPPQGAPVKGWWANLKPEDQARFITAATQAGGQALGGLFQGWSEEQKMEFQREIYETQQRNLAGQPSFGTRPVAAPRPSTGLLNAPRAA